MECVHFQLCIVQASGKNVARWHSFNNSSEKKNILEVPIVPEGVFAQPGFHATQMESQEEWRQTVAEICLLRKSQATARRSSTRTFTQVSSRESPSTSTCSSPKDLILAVYATFQCTDHEAKEVLRTSTLTQTGQSTPSQSCHDGICRWLSSPPDGQQIRQPLPVAPHSAFQISK